MLYSLNSSNLYSLVQHYVDEVRGKGADYVIALTHLGDDEVATEINSWELAYATSGIDVILDGHSHSTVPERHLSNKAGKDVIVSSTGEYLKNVGRLTINPNGKITTELVERESIQDPDQEVTELIEKINQEYDELGKRPIGQSEAELVLADGEMTRAVRCQEMGIGNFCVDAMRNAMHTDVAIMGGGSVRAPIHKGPLTFNDIFSVFPFGNTLAVSEISGKQLVDALEFSVYALPIEFGGFLQVSGIKFNVDARVDYPVTTDSGMKFTGFSGEKRRVSGVKILSKSGKYEPVDMNKMYSIAGLNFILKECGDGYEVLRGLSVTDTGILDSQLLESYIVETLGGVIPERYAKPEGRITIRK